MKQSVTSRSREFPFPGILPFFLWYRNRNQKNLVPKKVSELVSKKFGTEKSLGIGIVQILGLVTHYSQEGKLFYWQKNISASKKTDRPEYNWSGLWLPLTEHQAEQPFIPPPTPPQTGFVEILWVHKGFAFWETC